MAEVKLPDPKEWARKAWFGLPWESNEPLPDQLAKLAGCLQRDTLRAAAQRFRDGEYMDYLRIEVANELERMAEEIR